VKLDFYQDQIADWATLSGDYNPIHFDETHARQVGLNGIVVHGMLPLMHIKNKIADEIELQEENKWVTIKAIFRQPVERFLIYVLETKTHKERCRFSLRATEDGNQVISGAVYHDKPDINAALPLESFVIDTDRFCMKKTIFTKLYPSFDKTWLLFDTITFSEFINNEIPFIAMKNLLRLNGASSQNDLMKKSRTLQTSHMITIEPSFFSMNIEDLNEQCDIRCQVLTPMIVQKDSENLIALYPLYIWLNKKIVMMTEIGLHIRF